jgi:hypothetical protein
MPSVGRNGPAHELNSNAEAASQRENAAGDGRMEFSCPAAPT